MCLKQKIQKNVNKYHLKFITQGLPWWSCGKDPALSMQGTWVQSLVVELRSHKPNGVCSQKLKKKKNLN